MKWISSPPKLGQTKCKRRFAWLPVHQEWDGNVMSVWLEFYWQHYKFERVLYHVKRSTRVYYKDKWVKSHTVLKRM